MEQRNKEFKIAKYINDRMSYLSFNDFCSIKEIIRSKYNQLNADQKQVYKWYVYANIHTNNQQKNHIWDYLNGYEKNRDYFAIKENSKH